MTGSMSISGSKGGADLSHHIQIIAADVICFHVTQILVSKLFANSHLCIVSCAGMMSGLIFIII